MKKLLVSLAVAGAVFGVAGASFAQVQGQKQEGSKVGKFQHKKGQFGARKGGHKGGQFLEKLNLTEDQKAKLKEHGKRMRERSQALRAEFKNNQGNKEAMKEKFKALRQNQIDGVKSILTADQLKQLEEMRKANKDKRQKRGGSQRGGNR